ncbi:hypothetical protein FO519_006843 [Halicephalobus sp. NKZ332]|nr:hypothetical protein FO519_006843 [Halicephalobus sp. NKZ332]
MSIDLNNITCCRMNNESCLYMNDVLWTYREDLSTRPLTMATFAFFYSLIIIFGILGNLCVVLAISRTRSLQTVPNMFIFSLSCSDIVVCCTSATITPITAFKKDWIFGSFLCSAAPFIAGVSLCFSTFTLAAISIDRFLLIRYPMQKPFNHAQASVAIILICILSMILSAPTIFTQKLSKIDKYCGNFCYEDWGSHNSRRRAYGTVMLTLQFIIPLSIITICYTAISVRLGQSLILKTKKRDYEWQLQMTDQQRAANKRRQRTNRMFIAMVVAFSLSWFWSVFFNVLRDYEMLPEFAKKQEFFVGILTHCLAMTSTVWNPLLYAMLNLQLRAAFVQLMPECLKEYCCCSKVTSAGSPIGEEASRRRVPTLAVGNGSTSTRANGCRSSNPNNALLANNCPVVDEFNEDDDERQIPKFVLRQLLEKVAESVISLRTYLGEKGIIINSCFVKPVRSSSTRRKESFGLYDMLSRRSSSERRGIIESTELKSGHCVDSIKQVPVQNKSQYEYCSVILLDRGSPDGSADRYAILRRNSGECQSHQVGGLAPEPIRGPGERIHGGTPPWKAARVLGLFELDLDEDRREIGWWTRRKSASEYPKPSGEGYRHRSASTRLDVPQDGNGGQFLGLGGVVKPGRRSRSLTKSAFDLIGKISSPHSSRHSMETPRSPRSPRSPMKVFPTDAGEYQPLVSPDSSQFYFDQSSELKIEDDFC